MKAIWKYPFPTTDIATISMPAGAKILCVQTQNNMPCLWALVDIEAEPEFRKIVTYGTGHQHEAIQGVYVGTYLTHGGTLVFHVFDETPPS